jgi:hypothetical protein
MSKFKVGDKVVLKVMDALIDHSRSVPPSQGYSSAGFKWRRILDELKDKT